MFPSEKANFDGEIMIKKYSVGGMSCAACAAGIERVMRAVKGVNNAEVSLMGKCMTVDYDGNADTENEFLAAVKKLGYTIGDYKNVTADRDKDKTANVLKKRFLSSITFLLALMYFAMGEMWGLPVPPHVYCLILQAAFALALIAINFKFYTSGFAALTHGVPNMDTLVLLSSFSAYVFSLVVTVLTACGVIQDSKVFFEATGMVLTLVTLGKWLEELCKKKTGSEIEKLSSLLPDEATVKRGEELVTVKVADLVKGDIVVYKTGDYLTVDGSVISGTAALDKSAITGESLPVEVGLGAEVVSGSIVRTGYIEVKAVNVGEGTLFNKIVQTVLSASASKAPVQKLADKISGIFVPTVSVLAVITFAIWYIATGDLFNAVSFGISVLVVSCPCALGLATPVAVMAVSGRAASLGVLYKDAETVEKITKVNCILLDKTATVTEGRPKVEKFVNYSGKPDEEIFALSSSLEKMSSHPLAACVTEFCGEAKSVAIESYEYVPGKGIKAKAGGKEYLLGNRALIESVVKNVPAGEEGYTEIYLAENDAAIAAFYISDPIKQGAKEAILSLKAAGIKLALVSGDNPGAVKLCADKLGIEEYYASVLPQDKYKIVEKYQGEGYFTAMCGDGVNDSPAIKRADVGVAMGGGTDIAIDSASVVLTGGDLKSLSDAVTLGKKAYGIIKGNLFWAFIYNVLAIPVAAGALSFAGITLTPAISSACMCLSSLFVVTNALRINGYKKNKKVKNQNKGAGMKIYIDGMMCKHCEKKVFDTLSGIENAGEVTVNLKKKYAVITGDADPEKVKEEIAKAGYTVKKIEK